MSREIFILLVVLWIENLKVVSKKADLVRVLMLGVPVKVLIREVADRLRQTNRLRILELLRDLIQLLLPLLIVGIEALLPLLLRVEIGIGMMRTSEQE
jgi:uncharacterized membrane protein YiaA